MALKDLDDTTPRTRDKKWKEDIPLADLPKIDEYYSYRVLGGVYSYVQHWIEFTNKDGQQKFYPVDCANWDPETETYDSKGGCPACEAGISGSVKYLLNVIDRQEQGRGDPDPVRALDVPSGVVTQIKNLKKLNMVKGEPRSVAHPKFGIDIYVAKVRSKKKGGTEWDVQKGDRAPLTEDEMQYELIPFDEKWLAPDTTKVRQDLTRHGYFSGGDEEEIPAKKKKRKTSDDDDDFEAPKRRKLKSYDEEEDDGFEESPRRRASRDENPSRPSKSRPVEEDDDFESVPSKSSPYEDDDDDDDDFEEKPKKKAKRRPPEDEDDDDDFDDDFDV